jgi:hypothetical protein
MLPPFALIATETILGRKRMSDFALNWYRTYSSMFPALSNRQHWWALCPAPKSKGERLQQHSIPVLFCGYRRASFRLCGKGSPTACFPRCLLQPAIMADSCRRLSHRWMPLLQHQELVVGRRCSPLPDNSSDRSLPSNSSDRYRQLAAVHLKSSSICTTGAKSVLGSAKQRAAASCAAAVPFAARPAMV